MCNRHIIPGFCHVLLCWWSSSMVLILTTHFDSANGTVVVMSAQQHGIASHHRTGLWKDAHMTQQIGQDKSKRTKCRTAKKKGWTWHSQSWSWSWSFLFQGGRKTTWQAGHPNREKHSSNHCQLSQNPTETQSDALDSTQHCLAC